jgi:hypothetical protein
MSRSPEFTGRLAIDHFRLCRGLRQYRPNSVLTKVEVRLLRPDRLIYQFVVAEWKKILPRIRETPFTAPLQHPHEEFAERPRLLRADLTVTGCRKECRHIDPARLSW